MHTPAQPRSSILKVATASFVGTAIEWYDFFIYGTAAALTFNKLFFPSFEPLVGTLAAFATFAVGFLARPLGGVVFGHFGDRLGRKAMLSLTLVVMGAATFAVGLLPTYDQVGLWAPALLVVLRLVQGFGLGGEWGGAVLMAVEHAPAHRRGFYGSWPQMGAPAGLLLANGVFSLFSGMGEQAFLAWGWRVPFLLSAALIAVGYFIRTKVAESPDFEKVRQSGHEARLPVVEALKTHPKEIALAMGARFAENGFFYIFTTFVLAYGVETLQLPRTTLLAGVLVATAVHLLAIPAFGALSDRWGRRPVYLAGALFSAALAFPFFWLVETKSTALIFLAISLGTFGHAAMYGPQASFFSELFGARVRYTGASLGYQMASVFAGGLSPLVSTALLTWAGGATWAVSAYMLSLAAVTLVSVWLAAETRRPQQAAASAGASAKGAAPQHQRDAA